MKIRKNLAKALLLYPFLTSSVFAIEGKVKFGGNIEFQSAFYNSTGAANQRTLSVNKEQYGFYSSASFFLDMNLINDTVKYGAKIGIEHTMRNDNSSPFSVYVESPYGKVEAGSDKSVNAKMRITGYNAACGPGNGWDMLVKPTPDGKKVAYITNAGNFLDPKFRTRGKVEYSRKISYYTPKISLGEQQTVQVGISFIPDTANAGYAADVSALPTHNPVSTSNYNFAIRNGFAYGMVHEFTFDEQKSVKTAIVAENGKVTAVDNDGDTKTGQPFKDLFTYVAGAEINYDKMQFALSYGNYNRSLTASDVDTQGKETYHYSAGAKYKFDPYAVSLNYFHSDNKHNKLDATSIAIDYNLAPGIKLYSQATLCNTNGSYLNAGVKKKDKATAKLLVVGMKLTL